VDSDKERAILEHAWKTSVDPVKLTNEDFAKLKRVGFSEEEIVEIQELIALSFEMTIMTAFSVDS
jgi:alkylhydroperoxidase family enzyme